LDAPTRHTLLLQTSQQLRHSNGFVHAAPRICGVHHTPSTPVNSHKVTSSLSDYSSKHHLPAEGLPRNARVVSLVDSSRAPVQGRAAPPPGQPGRAQRQRSALRPRAESTDLIIGDRVEILSTLYAERRGGSPCRSRRGLSSLGPACGQSHFSRGDMCPAIFPYWSPLDGRFRQWRSRGVPDAVPH
jgi:hypothetical protein